MHSFDAGAVAGSTRGGIDNLDHVDGLPGLVFHPKPAVAAHGAPILVSGWVVDPETDGPAAEVIVLLDRTRVLPARIGIARGDIMIDHGTDEFVGFQLAVDTTDLGAGSHELRVYAHCSDGLWYESAAAGFRLYHCVFGNRGSLGRPLRMALDGRVDLTSGTNLKVDEPVRGNHWIQLQGWTYDPVTQKGASRIAVIDENGRMWSGPADCERPDVASAIGIQRHVGFEIVVPAAVFERGRHQLEIAGFDDAGLRYTNGLKVQFDVIAERLRFPLTARCLSQPASIGAQLSIFPKPKIAGDRKKGAKAEAEPSVTVWPLPAAFVDVSDDAELIIDGWALDAHERPGDDIYIEITPRWATVPPQRLPASSGWMELPESFKTPKGGKPGSYFFATLRTSDLTPGEWDVAIIVVQPDRCSYARTPITTVRIF